MQLLSFMPGRNTADSAAGGAVTLRLRALTLRAARGAARGPFRELVLRLAIISPLNPHP